MFGFDKKKPEPRESGSTASAMIVEGLLNCAEQDAQLLAHNRSIGDVAEAAREIDFAFHARDEKLASLVCNFMIDNKYGRPVFERIDDPAKGGLWRVTVFVHAPATDNVVCSISGLMTVIAMCFGLEYVGWGSVIQNREV